MRNKHWVAFFLASGLIAAGIVGVLLQIRYAAFQDLGEWIYHSATLATLWSGGEPPNGATFVDHPVPNALPQLLLGVLTYAFGAALAPVIFLILYALSAGLATEALVRRYGLPPVTTSTFLAVATILGTGFWNGFISAQWGLVLLLIYWSVSQRVATSWVALVSFSILAFFTHGLTFACWGVLALARVIDARRFWRLPVSVLPSLLAAAWYFVSSHEGRVEGLFSFEGGALPHLFYKAYTAAKMGGYQNLVFRNAGDAEVSPSLYWTGVSTNVLFVLLVVTMLVTILWRGAERRALLEQRGTALAIGLLLLVTLAMPPYLFGVVNPGERTLAALAVVLTPVLFGAEKLRILRRLLVGTAVAGLTLTGASLLTLSMKAGMGDSPSQIVIGFEDRNSKLFAHRLDQFEERVKDAQRGDLSEPLAFTTSVLRNP